MLKVRTFLYISLFSVMTPVIIQLTKASDVGIILSPISTLHPTISLS